MTDDLISRQAVQDYIAKYLSQYLYNDVREAVEAIDEYIGELPPVTQKPETVTEFADRCRECGARYGKLLKQEPKADVFGKIRAEIKALSNANPSYWHSGDMVEREEVFEIIDKYKAESEDEE